jgi:hypothetical protein
MSNMAGGGDLGSSGRTGSSDTPQHVKDAVRETTQQVASAAKDQVNAVYEKKKNVVFDEVGNLASALREAGNKLRSQDDDSIAAKVTDRVAERLETVSTRLGGKNLDSIIRDVENFGRSNAAVFLGTAAALGFFAIRFMKSSAPDQMGAGWSSGGPRNDFASDRSPMVAYGEDV